MTQEVTYARSTWYNQVRLAARALPTKIRFSKKAESTSQNLLMKIERVITDLAVVESPNRAESEVFGLSLTFLAKLSQSCG